MRNGWIALVTLVAFGCATVRVPVASSGEPMDAAGTIAPPIVELWLESSGDVPPQVSRAAEGDAREALAGALGSYEISSGAAGATDAVLFVRERAVGLTAERRSQQTWAKVGMVVGIVLVVAAAVYLAATGGGKGSSRSAKTASAPAPKTTQPIAAKPQATPAPRPPPSLGHAAPMPAPYAYPYHSSPIYVGFWFQFSIPPRPLALAPESVESDPWGAPEPPVPYAPPESPFDPGLDFPPPPPPEPIEAVALQLPPLSETVRFPFDDRGLLSGPQTALQLDLIDRATGQLLWTKAVSAEVDPLDGAAVAGLVDKAFDRVPWARPHPR